MKAWHVQDRDGEKQEIVFAETRTKAIYESEAYGWTEYIDIRAKRAKYADGLEVEPEKLIQVQLDNGWWFECNGNCTKQIYEESNYTIANKGIYCEECSKKLIVTVMIRKFIVKWQSEEKEFTGIREAIKFAEEKADTGVSTYVYGETNGVREEEPFFECTWTI